MVVWWVFAGMELERMAVIAGFIGIYSITHIEEMLMRKEDME